MNEKTIGKNIRTLRERCGMTKAELAERTSSSTDCIQEIEAGSHAISLALVLEICEALEVTPNDILAGLYPSGISGEAAVSHGEEQNSCENFYGDMKEEDAVVLEHMHYFLTHRKQK